MVFGFISLSTAIFLSNYMTGIGGTWAYLEEYHGEIILRDGIYMTVAFRILAAAVYIVGLFQHSISRK